MPEGGGQHGVLRVLGETGEGDREVLGSQRRETVLKQKSLAKSLHFNYKETDTHVNSHFAGGFLFLKELLYRMLHTWQKQL